MWAFQPSAAAADGRLLAGGKPQRGLKKNYLVNAKHCLPTNLLVAAAVVDINIVLIFDIQTISLNWRKFWAPHFSPQKCVV